MELDCGVSWHEPKPPVRCFLMKESGHSEEKVIDTMRCGDGVERDDAGRNDVGFVHMPLPLAFCLGQCFFLKSRCRDQAVAPQATEIRSKRSCDAEHVEYLAGRPVDLHLGADLATGYEVLVDDGVEHQSCLHGVCGENDVVAVDEALSDGIIRDVADDRFDYDVTARPSCDALDDRHLVGSRSLTECLYQRGLPTRVSRGGRPTGGCPRFGGGWTTRCVRDRR